MKTNSFGARRKAHQPRFGAAAVGFILALSLPGAAFAAPDGKPTQAVPVIYLIKNPTWVDTRLIFNIDRCAGKMQDSEIILTDGAHGRGWLCDGKPKEFSQFSIKVNGEWYKGDYAQFIRDALLANKARFLPVHYTEQNNPYQYYSPEGYTDVRVSDVRIDPLRTVEEFASYVAAKSATVSTQKVASGISTPAVIERELAASLAQSFARAPRIQIGLQVGMAKVSNASVHVDVAGVQTQDYTFEVKPGAKCLAAAQAKQRCSYTFRINYGGSFAGFQIPSQNTDWVTRSDVFSKSGSSYRSDQVDAYMFGLAEASSGQRNSNSNDDAEERKRKQKECMNQALLNGEMAFCPY